MMSKLIPGNQKHLTLEDRSEIERQLTLGTSITTIASLLCKDPTTISKEIKRHRVSQPHNHFNEPDLRSVRRVQASSRLPWSCASVQEAMPQLPVL